MVYESIKNFMEPQTRSSRIDRLIRFAVAMRFYATGTYQRCAGEEYFTSMSQSSVSKCLDEVTYLLERHVCPNWIKFPKEINEKTELKKQFYNATQFPGVIGCVDGTHINIIAPVDSECNYVDRMGKHSINVQLVSFYNQFIYIYF